MKKTISRMLALVVALVWAVSAMAQDAPVPGIKMFYPGANDENPMELKPTATAYIYFETGSKISSVKAQLIQEGAVLGTVTYLPTPTNATTVQMKPSEPENAVMATLQAGLFSLSVYEVVYTVDATEYTYSDTEAPVAVVTYRRGIANGSIVAESGMPDQTVYSYYKADDMDGVKTFTFSKAVKPEGVTAFYQYGQGNNYRNVSVPCVVSDDGLTITIDVRGLCYNVAVLAPGVTFYDDEGNPCPPPAAITLCVEGLNCVDGSKIASVATSLDGRFSANIEGQLMRNCHYVDLTFDNPVLESAVFYSSADPTAEFAGLEPGVDRMDLTISAASTIASCGVEFAGGGSSFVVAAEDVELSRKGTDAVLTCPVPAGIFSADLSRVAVSLVDVVYNVEDGAEHSIAPLVLNAKVNRAAGIAELKAYAPNSSVILSVEGMTVTYAEDNGYCFAEDATGGIQIVTPDYSVVFVAGQQITGTVPGTYLGDNIFMIDHENASYGSTGADVERGTQVDTLDELVSGAYDCRLVTLLSSESMPILNDDGMGMIGDAIPVITDLVGDDYLLPAEIDNVTGILYYEPALNMYMLLVRTADDVNRTLTSISSLGSVTAAPTGIYDLRGVRLPSADGRRGILIIDGRKVRR